MNLVRLRMKPYIQPFERRLALEELRTVAAAEPKPLGLLHETSVDFELMSPLSIFDLANRLAYWEKVESASGAMMTMQSLRESTLHTARNGVALERMNRCLPFKDDVPLPNRRCLRYGTHGIHEYRGKFFPQLVRSLINVSGAKSNGLVADPMSGSGTTTVEALLAGYRTIGLDMNPLSVFIANVKCELLSADVTALVSGYRQIRAQLTGPISKKNTLIAYLKSLPREDQEYLQGWFAEGVLADLDLVSQCIQRIKYQPARNLFRVALSNILRRVSLQKEDDLRVRRKVRQNVPINAKQEFLDELERSIRAVTAFLYQNGRVRKGSFEIVQGDARHCVSVWPKNAVDVVITSPPYATALPYLDTDRLSLCYLGLLPRPAHRGHDQRMIGNREVTEKMRQQYWQQFESNPGSLPSSVSQLIRKIDQLNSKAIVGFRRRNLPALLAKYFLDMKEVLSGIHEILKPRSFAFVVVGNNHTIAGHERVEIRTAALLQDIARGIGFNTADSLRMEMLVSRDIFRKNATASEEILALYKNP